MITVHHLNNSRSQRILWLLEELGVPYEVKHYQRDPRTKLAPPELKKIHPLGKSPVVTDGELVLAESGAIVDYLVRKYGKGEFVPKSEEDLISYNYWLHFAEGSAMTPLLFWLVFSEINKKAPFFVKPLTKAISQNVGKLFIEPNLSANLDFMEKELTRKPWFAGASFTGADIQMSFPIEGADALGRLHSYPKIKNFLETIKKRKAYQEALKKGGPYSILN